MTNIETTADINGLVVAQDRRGQSGVLMIAGEQPRIMSYFIPQLGPAPKWCSFLENLTEELEENSKASVYEDYKFVTRQEIEELGATGLIGSPMLKSYMHGFFMEMKLYNKLRAVSKPFEYEEYRKQKIREKIEEKRQNRISVTKNLPKVNKDLAAKLLRKVGDSAVDPKTLVDDRFKAIFERSEFQRDENDDYYKLHNPVKAKQRKRDLDDSDNELVMYEEEDEDERGNHSNHDSDKEAEAESDFEYDPAQQQYADEDLLVNHKKSKKPKKNGKNAGGDHEEEEIGEIARASMRYQKKQHSPGNKKMKMFSLAEGITPEDVVYANPQQQKEKRQSIKMLQSLPIQERLERQTTFRNTSSDKKVDTGAKIRNFRSKSDGNVREISFIPKPKGQKR